jgi:hypothetical protein
VRIARLASDFTLNPPRAEKRAIIVSSLSTFPALSPSSQTAPGSIGNLSQVFQASDSSARSFNVLTGFNLGNNTLLLSIPMHQFYEMSAVANDKGLAEQGVDGPVAQRKLDPQHAGKLATYILKGLVNATIMQRNSVGMEVSEALLRIQKTLGKQPYMSLQPIVANLRPNFGRQEGLDIQCQQLHPGVITVWLGDKDVLWVIDGQHRRYALELVFEFLKDIKMTHEYPKRRKLYPLEKGQTMQPDELAVWMEVFEAARTSCRMMVEVHIGISSDQERQLFHDLNNLGKKIETSLAFAFDNSNPINLFLKDELVDEHILGAKVVEKDNSDWHNDPGTITWKDLTAINAILFLNKTNIKGAQPAEVEERKAIAREFWESVSKIDHFGQNGARKLTIAAQPVLLKSLAKLTFDFAFGRAKDPELLTKILGGIPHLDLSHQNPMWRYYEMNPTERASSGLSGLADYLPVEHVDGESGGSANRDIGRFDPTDQVMRLGAKHNDIFPLLGDMIRWRLALPSRRGLTSEATISE